MHQVPIIGAAVVGRILTHRRHDDAVGKLQAGESIGREQGTHERNSRFRRGGSQVRNDGMPAAHAANRKSSLSMSAGGASPASFAQILAALMTSSMCWANSC